MTVYALICFAVAAVLGLTLATLYQKGKLSLKLAAVHGIFAASGLVLLIIAAMQEDLSRLGAIAIIIFIIAVLGGAVLIFNHLKKHSLPKPLIGIHGSVAVIAFLMLLFGTVS